MVNTSLNTAMGDAMRRCMRKRHLTQDCLAQYLGTDRKTVSKLLAGKIMPSLELLERILTGIGADQETKFQVRQMAKRLHLGCENKAAWTYANLRQLREKRGLSLPMLSNRTGLTTARLTLLEDGRDTPTEQDDALLRRTLDSKGLLTVSDRGRGEDGMTDMTRMGVPLLKFADLAVCSDSVRLSDVVLERAGEKIFWDIDSAASPAAVLAECRELQLALPGIAVLAVTEASGTPERGLELWRDRQGFYSLREFAEGGWRPCGLTAQDAVLAPKVWSLPVLDMVFKPFNYKIGAADQ